MVLDNDTRGWIMTAVSGIGASAICVQKDDPDPDLLLMNG
jgi:hypothetical protein